MGTKAFGCEACRHSVARVFTERRGVMGEAGSHERSAAIFMPVLVLYCGHAPSVASGIESGEPLAEQLSVEHREGLDHVSGVLRTIPIGSFPEAVGVADIPYSRPPSWCRVDPPATV